MLSELKKLWIPQLMKLMIDECHAEAYVQQPEVTVELQEQQAMAALPAPVQPVPVPQPAR